MKISSRFCPPTLAELSDVDARWLVYAAGTAIALLAWAAMSLYTDSPWHAWDAQVARWLADARTPGLTAWMLLLTHANSNLAIHIYVAIIALAWTRCRAWKPIALLVWVVPGGLLLNVLVKHLIARPRPLADEALLHLSTFSFPSGHVAGATLLYGLAAVILSRSKPRAQGSLIVIGGFGMIALTGLSRIYLGVHYLSDVIGGVGLGGAWLTLSLLLMRWLARKKLVDGRKKTGTAA